MLTTPGLVVHVLVPPYCEFQAQIKGEGWAYFTVATRKGKAERNLFYNTDGNMWLPAKKVKTHLSSAFGNNSRTAIHTTD